MGKGRLIAGILLSLFSMWLLSGCHTSKSVPSHAEYKEQKGKITEERLGIEITKSDNRDLLDEAASWIGVSYRYGGNTKSGIDCSGLVVQIYSRVYDKKLYRNSDEIRKKNCKKISKSKLKQGNLVFFATGKSKKKVNHVGIYLKDGKFIHASTSRGVIVSDLEEPYYRRTFVSCGIVK